MRGYGLPRHNDVAYPDLGDISFYGLKAGRLHPKWTAKGDNKRRARRIWKKKARREGKRSILKELSYE